MAAPGEQVILDAIPATGDIPYDALRDKLMKSGNERALKQFFHDMRKRGVIEVVRKETPDGVVTVVSRGS